MWDRKTRIPRDELEDRRAYKLQSRNLFVGFWNERANGFNGIREKFGDRYIFMEYLYEDQGGTALAYEPLDLWLPEDIPNTEYLGSFCQECDKPVKSLGEGLKPRGWGDNPDELIKVRCIGWTHVDFEDRICPREGEYMSYVKGNKAMLDLLTPYDNAIAEEKRIECEKWETEYRASKGIE